MVQAHPGPQNIEHMKRLGYREMLRDRCPKIVNYALKWQKAKELWIEHTYSYFVRIVGEERDIDDNTLIHSAKENKKIVVRQILGIVRGKTTRFDFDKSIDWDNLTDEETVFWKRVSTWVKWFSTNYAYIENAYEISIKTGKTELDAKIEIINSYLSFLMPDNNADEETKKAKYAYIDNLVNFLIRCFDGKN